MKGKSRLNGKEKILTRETWFIIFLFRLISLVLKPENEPV